MTLTKELGTHLLDPLVGYIWSGKVEQKRRSRRRARLQNCSPVPSGPSALPTSLKPTVVLVASAFVVTFSFGSWSPFQLPRHVSSLVEGGFYCWSVVVANIMPLSFKPTTGPVTSTTVSLPLTSYVSLDRISNSSKKRSQSVRFLLFCMLQSFRLFYILAVVRWR